MATKPPSLHDLFVSRPMQTQSDVAYSNVLDDRDPVKARQARQVGLEVGLPGATVEADLPGFQQEAYNNKTLDMLGNDPALSRFLVDPHNAAAVKDDLPSLSEISSIFKLADEPGGDPTGRNFINYMKNTRLGKRGRLLDAFMISTPKNDYSFEALRRPVAADVFRDGRVNAPIPSEKLTPGTFAEGIEATVTSTLANSGRGIESFLADAVGLGEEYRNTKYYRDITETIRGEEERAAKPAEQIDTYLGKQAYAATQSLAQMGAAIASDNPILAMSLMQGAPAYAQLRDRGATREEALVSATVQGAAEGFFEKYFGLGWMLGNFGKKATGKFIGGLFLREVPSEVATTAVQDLADAMVTGGGGWEGYKKRLPQDLLDTAVSTAMMVGMVGGIHKIGSVVAPERRAMDEIGQAAAGAEFLDNLMAVGEKSKVRKESPDTLRDFVDERTQDSPVRNVYVPVEAAVEYMQSENYGGELDHYKDQIAQAQATQGDVVIPVADAVAHLSGTPAWEALKEQVRATPGGLSRKEATEKHAEIIATLEQRGKEIAQEAEQTDERKGAAAEVYIDVKNRLRVAGVDEKQSDAVAQLYAARYEARAARRGGTPMEQFKASKIVFPGESADGTIKGREVAQEGAQPTVNIGLNVNDGSKLEVQDVVSALSKAGVTIKASQVQQSATEPTFVAQLNRALTPKEAHQISVALKQDAIAQHSGTEGALFGPAAEKWGPFNPDFFLPFEQAPRLRQDVLPEAGWTAERISGLIDQYGLEDGSSSAIAVMMSPDEYLGLMANIEGRRAIEERVTQMADYGALDLERLRNSPPIVMRVALGGENDTRPPPMVRGHDGRHRMMMLKLAGVREVPVVVQLSDKNGKPISVKTKTDIGNILGNRSRASQTENGDAIGAIRGGIPLSWRFKDQLEDLGQRTLNQEPIAPFYSALERAVEAMQTKRAPAAQWKATLARTPGVKQEELEWSGLTDWLDMQKGPVDREALLGVVRNGGISVDEVVLGRPEEELLAYYGADRSSEDAELIISDGALQFQNWSSDPRNESYRELLITLPLGERGNPQRAPATHWDQEGVVAHARFMDKTDAEGKRVLFIEEVQSDWHQKGRDQGYSKPVDPKVIADAAKAEEEATAKANAAGLALMPYIREAVPNLEESETSPAFALAKVLEAHLHLLPAARQTAANIALQKWRALDLRYQELTIAHNQAKRSEGIPNAPFKSSWPALVMKRMIRWAVDHGYDKIAWTTGEEQANRYNLSEAVGTLKVKVLADGRYVVVPGKVSVWRILSEQGLSVDELHDGIMRPVMTVDQMKQAFGNDLAGRMQAQARAGESYAEISGDDLRVGGEGMKAFYDRNLVNITNDIIKKYGAKVEKVGVVGGSDRTEIARLENQATIDRATGDAVVQQGDERRAELIYDVANQAAEEAQRIRAGDPHPGFEITPKMAEAANSGFPLFQDQGGPRGSVTLQDNGAKIIQLFGTANRSTLLHETGHIWLEELRDDATAADATDQDKADWAAVSKWFKANGFALQGKGFIPRDAHELWARGVERYFMEGKAPTEGLRGVFKTFRAWLLRIYQVVQNLGSPITPEIREVMDRLIATQEALDETARQNATEPLFKSAEDAGMTDAEFADYQTRVANARDEAYDTLLYKTMEAIRRQRTQETRDQRSAIRAEVGSEVNRQPQFRLLHLLRTGKWLGEPDRPAQPVKLNTGWLIDNFGENVLERLPRGIQIYNASGETGDVIAEMVGLKSGAEVVQTLLGMRAASDALRAQGETRSMRDVMIAEEVDRIMAERHGDTMDDGSIEEEAIAALNTARQGEIIASEARQLAKRKNVLGVPTPYQFAREWARRTVAAGHVRDVASRAAMQRYLRAANKAARNAETAILEGDVDEAYRQKQAQLLNHALLAEAKAAGDRIDRIIARMRKLAKRAGMKSIDPEYMAKIHMLLENYDFRPRSQKSIDEEKGFQEWIERQRAQGFEVHIPPRLENNGDPYTRVSVQELDSLSDLIESLMHLGRTKQKLKIAQTERDFSEFRDEVVARIKALPDRKAKKQRWWKSGKLTKNSPINEPNRMLADAASELLKVETIVEELDGGPTGPLHDAIVLGATTAENRRFDLRAKVLLPIAKMYHEMSFKQRRRLQERVTIPELTWNSLNEGDPRIGTSVTMTRSELLSVLMNMGNLSNLEKLSKGERWPVDTLRIVMDREMTKEDYDFAQKLWDQVGLLWPDIVATEREQAGVVPEKVVNSPIETKFGTYEGGYWPVVYDPARWQLAEDLEGKQFDDMFGIKTGVATQKGHTITRTGAYGPIQLSLESVLFSHIEQVVTRIAFAGYARDVLRIVRDRSIRGWIDTKLGPEYRKQFEKWLGRQVHEGATHAKAARWWDGLMRHARINMTIAAMGFRFSTGVAQTLGLTASAQRIGAKWVGVGMKRLALQPREMTAFVYARSPELLHRTEAVNREVAEVARKMRGRHGVITEAQHWAMWHIGFMDRYTVALPTWLGAHTRGMSEGMTDAEASAYADKSVRQSQGSGREKDLSAIQSPNNETMRFFTMFYTPWNVMFNAQWQGVRGLKRGDVRPMIAVTFWWGIVSMLGDAMLSGDWPKDDKEPMDWAAWFGRNVFFGLFAGIPLLRDGANYAESKMIGQYVSDVGTTPITRISDAIEKAVKIGKKVHEGEEIERPIKQAGDLTAILFGVPTSQLGTTAQFAWDKEHGNIDPQTLSDWYFGITRDKKPKSEEEAAR